MLNAFAYQKSVDLLRKAATPNGFTAAVAEHDNYRRIWARDGVFTALAALLTDATPLHDTARQTLVTLFDHQHTRGFIPSNVAADLRSVSYGGNAGRADAPCWAVIGLCVYSKRSGDSLLAKRYLPHVAKCFDVLEAWEFNGKHLVYVPQSGDWADEYIQHGYILFEQLLRVWALEAAADLYGNEQWAQKAKAIRGTLEANFSRLPSTQTYYAPNLPRQLQAASTDYWLMGFNPARVYTYFDLQANALALLLGLGDGIQNGKLLAWLTEQMQAPMLLPSFAPTITQDHPDIHELRDNFAFSFRNTPGQFHNGGLWPVWNGLMAAALAKAGRSDLAEMLTQAIHAANALANDQFNECLDGYSGQICGVPHCTWSAAGAVWAEQALSGNYVL